MRIYYFLLQWLNLSDPAVEEASYFNPGEASSKYRSRSRPWCAASSTAPFICQKSRLITAILKGIHMKLIIKLLPPRPYCHRSTLWCCPRPNQRRNRCTRDEHSSVPAYVDHRSLPLAPRVGRSSRSARTRRGPHARLCRFQTQGILAFSATELEASRQNRSRGFGVVGCHRASGHRQFPSGSHGSHDRGIKDGVVRKEAKLLRFTAEMDLILVDGLEAFFNSRPAAR